MQAVFEQLYEPTAPVTKTRTARTQIHIRHRLIILPILIIKKKQIRHFDHTHNTNTDKGTRSRNITAVYKILLSLACLQLKA